MNDNEDSLSAAMRKIRTMAWQNAKGAEDSGQRISSSSMRQARREAWANADGKPAEEVKPSAPTPSTAGFGLNDDPRVVALESRMSNLLDRLDRIEDDFAEDEKGEGGGIPTPYESYFRVIDASTETDCKIGVTSGAGAVGEDGVCGTVKINAARVDVNEFTGAAITAAGTYYVWLHSWFSATTEENAEIIIGDQFSPDNPNGGIAYASQVLARVTVIESDGVFTISRIVQDYLSGGEHLEPLWRNCVLTT